ncbi:site-specific DNA-methyltransferase [uncultured Xanthomonas sp.]|uniref:site-specific DNA-methyltransferase n=1 Tax=uncultured Xanthomonas sp. TaxID=152831 RepID=UPI0025F6E480|nr:site-specific DNA-methyltransferase [uncultured Xanthomonas sp.]
MPWLEWYKRDDDLKAAAKTPYRLLQPIQSLSHGDENAPNMLIQGDNLEALRALLPYYAGQVKCIFIDPPYNTQSAFEHYDDNLEHAQWLSMMYPRMVLLRELLAEDGIIWITLDDSEGHYFKVICDEIFGRKNFLSDIAYERSGVSGLGQGGGFVVNTHERIFVYAKDKKKFVAVDLSGSGVLEAKDMKRYNQILLDPGRREEVARFVAPSTGQDVVVYKHSGYKTSSISLRKFEDRKDEILLEYADKFESIYRLTSVQEENEFQNRIMKLCGDGLYSADYLVSRGRAKGENATTYYIGKQIVVWLRDTAKIEGGEVVRTGKLSDFWAHRDIPKADLANEGGVDFRRGKKPEALLARVLRISTRKDDLVLDSFLGSGTTAAVAHKMGRRWIGVESGDQAQTHSRARLISVVDGEQSGVSKQVEWTGGGGFSFYKLGPKVFDDQGRMNPEIKFEHLAAHIWFAETGTARSTRAMKSPLLGVHNGTAYYLLYNGILGEKTLAGGNMLTMKALERLQKHDGPMVIYGEGTNMTNDRLRSLGITFRKTPNDIRAR